MFTGLVQDMGRVTRADLGPGGLELAIHATFADLKLGESIAVQGTCLTVAHLVPGGFKASVSEESLARTTLKALRVDDSVNLERSLAFGDRLGGHLVSGHVDGVGKVASRADAGDAVRVKFTAPRELMPLVAEKGSITVDGVSLTVNAVGDAEFEVMLVPHTMQVTTLGALKPGTEVNLEVDMLARYVARILETRG